MRSARWLVPGLLLMLLVVPWNFDPRRGPPAPELARGQVWARGAPASGAVVRYQASGLSSTTDAEGRFHLPRKSYGRVTAWKEGHFITGAPANFFLDLHLAPLPAQDFEEYSWVGPAPLASAPHNCGHCHATIYQEWSASGHARSVTSRHFLNLYEGTDYSGRRAGWSLHADRPDGIGVCNACHAPSAGFDLDLRQAKAPEAWGVHCDFCHKVADVDNQQIGLTHGRYGLKLLRPSEGQIFFGPLDDVDRGEDAFSPIYRESRYCASCHEGTIFGVPVYTTYSEWERSPARREGKQCQTCHMAPTGQMRNLAPGHGGIERDPMSLASHRFLAGSLREMLQHCLKVSVHFEKSVEQVSARIEVLAEDVGHRVPTGFIDRNLVLVVEGFDGAGKTQKALAGPILPPIAGLEFAGRPGQLFAKVLKDENNPAPMPFWRGPAPVVDSRLIPGRPSQSLFSFPTTTKEVRIQLLYHRFWPAVARTKKWPDNEIIIFDTVKQLTTSAVPF